VPRKGPEPAREGRPVLVGLAVELLAGIRLQIAALDDIEMLARRGVPDSKGTVRVVLAGV
jgi:hypothetical protein